MAPTIGLSGWVLTFLLAEPSAALLPARNIWRPARLQRALSLKLTEPPPTTLASEVPGLMRMARLNTVPMGAGLVALGALGARGAIPAGGFGWSERARLGLGVILTVIVTSGSMLINDYHDHKLGVDTAATKPGRPLVTGEVRPSTVKLVLKWAYALHLALLCLVDSASMRLWVLANSLLTYVYSVHLKPVTGVKNLTCAAIVAMGLGLGALGVGAGTTGVVAVWRPMAVVLGLIWHREIVMDIKDEAGDRLAGVVTVPVACGPKPALRLSLIPLGLAALVTASAPPPAAAAAATLAMLAQASLALSAMRKGFDGRSLALAIELAPAWLLVALLALSR